MGRESHPAGRTIAVDGHVHFHACFEPEAFLDGAARNFADAGQRAGCSTVLGVLCLTECAGSSFFRELRDGALGRGSGPWSFRRTGEPISLLALQDGEPRLVLVAGRQHVTAEGLELLAVGCDSDIGDGLPVREAMERVAAADGLPILPWGVGKWRFARRRLISAILEEPGHRNFFLGDNGGRWALLPRPALLARAERAGIRVLPGTDPLPFAGESGRAGSFGFLIGGALDLAQPACALKQLLRDRATPIEPYGRGERLGAFLRKQVSMQLRKRAR